MVAVFALAISAHEAAHAYAAKKCGDLTADRMGRISLNPLVHVDLFGTILLPAFLILSGSPLLFGWAKPVPVNTANLNNPRRDSAIVSAAGPMTNLLLVLVGVTVTVIFFPLLRGVEGALRLLYFNTVINVVLMVFNLIPVPPLDGGKIFHYFASAEQEKFLREHSYLLMIGFLLLLFTGILGQVFGFFINFVLSVQQLLLVFVWGV